MGKKSKNFKIQKLFKASFVRKNCRKTKNVKISRFDFAAQKQMVK